jgi:hypothetical protein
MMNVRHHQRGTAWLCGLTFVVLLTFEQWVCMCIQVCNRKEVDVKAKEVDLCKIAKLASLCYCTGM